MPTTQPAAPKTKQTQSNNRREEEEGSSQDEDVPLRLLHKFQQPHRRTNYVEIPDPIITNNPTHASPPPARSERAKSQSARGGRGPQTRAGSGRGPGRPKKTPATRTDTPYPSIENEPPTSKSLNAVDPAQFLASLQSLLIPSGTMPRAQRTSNNIMVEPSSMFPTGAEAQERYKMCTNLLSELEKLSDPSQYGK